MLTEEGTGARASSPSMTEFVGRSRGKHQCFLVKFTHTHTLECSRAAENRGSSVGHRGKQIRGNKEEEELGAFETA